MTFLLNKIVVKYNGTGNECKKLPDLLGLLVDFGDTEDNLFVLFSLVFCCAVESNEVEHLAHTGADAVAIVIFEFGGGEVGCGVSDHVVIDKVIVAR